MSMTLVEIKKASMPEYKSTDAPSPAAWKMAGGRRGRKYSWDKHVSRKAKYAHNRTLPKHKRKNAGEMYLGGVAGGFGGAAAGYGAYSTSQLTGRAMRAGKTAAARDNRLILANRLVEDGSKSARKVKRLGTGLGLGITAGGAGLAYYGAKKAKKGAEGYRRNSIAQRKIRARGIHRGIAQGQI